MKKIISTILMVIALQSLPVQAGLFDQGCCQTTCCDSCCDGMGAVTIAAKFAAYFPLERRARKVFHNALPNFEVEVATTWCDWQPWFNVGYIWDNGRSRGCHEKTRLSVVPLSLGVNYIIPMCNCIDAYIGAGAVYSFLRTRDHSDFVRNHHPHRNAWGAIVKAGFYYNYSECVFFEGFVDYVYTHFHFKRHRDEDDLFVTRHDVNLSGIKLGVGVGFKF